MNAQHDKPDLQDLLTFGEFCPDEATVHDGFIVFNDSRVHEIHHLPNGVVRQLTYFPDGAQRESTYFAGLLKLEDFEAGIRYTPRSDLTELLAFSVGRSYSASFDVLYKDMPPAVLHTELRIEKRKMVKVGSCRYEVIEIAHSSAFDGQVMGFTHVSVYSPLLKYVLAMRMSKRGTVTAAPMIAPLSHREHLLVHIGKGHKQAGN